jgi:salicylate hydroxylase
VVVSSIIHRADYQQILFDEARSMGAEIRFGTTLEDVDFEGTRVVLEGGERVAGDFIIGADGSFKINFGRV